MYIKIKVGDTFLQYEEIQKPTDFPRILSRDKFKDKTKSERAVEIVKELVQMAVKANDSQYQENINEHKDSSMHRSLEVKDL